MVLSRPLKLEITQINYFEDFKISEYLTTSEMKCPCCGIFLDDKKLFFIFDKIQEEWDYFLRKRKMALDDFYKINILKVTSGFRCMKHHIEIYKKEFSDEKFGQGAWRQKITLESKHLWWNGGAIDISTEEITKLDNRLGTDYYFALLSIIKSKTKRIGHKRYNKRLIHFDIGEIPAEW